MAPTATTAASRFRSLDVLRGLAILLMIFSGMLPKTLPNWVDHGYQPHYRPNASGVWVSTLVDGSPPFDPRWKAFTWVDLVFPMFLFAMGAAIPLAMSRRLERDPSGGRAARMIFARFLMLVLFAVVVTQMTVWQLNWPQADVKRLLAIVGFVAAFAFFMRPPATWSKPAVTALRVVAVAMIVGLIAACIAKTNGTFGWDESDTIILVLAHTYLVAALLWLFTLRWGWYRLLLMSPLLLLAHYLQFSRTQFGDWMWLGYWPTALRPIASFPGTLLNLPRWLPMDTEAHPAITRLLNFSPLWNFTWYKFLWIVLPGTIVGDRVLAWTRGGRASGIERSAPRALFWLPIVITVVTCVGLRNYGFETVGVGGLLRTPWAAIVLTLPPVAWLGVLVLRHGHDVNAKLHRWLFIVGASFTLFGLMLACLPNPSAHEGFFEGGISKGSPATLSYYVLTVGLCTLLLMSLASMLDDPIDANRELGVIEANGQNPMLAYYIAHALLGAVLSLGVFGWLGRPFGDRVLTIENVFEVPLANWPWVYALWAATRTLLIAAFVWGVTKRRIFWRA